MSYGPVIRDGKLLYTSVSALATADPDQEGGCPRKWALRYVGGHREPSTPDSAAGTALHGEVHHYLTTGEDVLGRVNAAARRFLPERGADLRLEFEIGGTVAERAAGLTVLDAGGVPLVGKMDIAHTRGTYVTKSGALARDPEGTIELIDLKYPKTFQYIKSDDELMGTIQMPGYAEWAFREMPTLEHARLSHVYTKREGAAEARKATILVDREAVAKRWMRVDAIGRLIRDLAKESDPNKAPANTRACTAFRGCYLRNNPCRLDNDQSLAAIFGPRLADAIVKGEDMAHVELSLDDQIAALTGALAPAATLPVSQAFADAVATIRAVKLADGTPGGFPALSGPALVEYGKLTAYEGTGLPHADGSGPLGQKSFSAVDMVTTFAGALVASKLVAPQKYTAPAAKSTPPAVDPLAGLSGLLPPEAPPSRPELAADPVAPAAAAAPAAEKKTRAKKPDAPAPAPIDTASLGGGKTPAVEHTRGFGFSLFVDAITTAPSATSLASYVDELHAALCKATGDADVRGSSDDRLSFGKWKGALAALAREKPPAPGVYTLDTRDSELAAVVADALRGQASLYVRGVR